MADLLVASPTTAEPGWRRRVFWSAYAALYDAIWNNELTELVARSVLEELSVTAPGVEVLDVGAGTGLITRILVDNGHRVQAVEPDPAMRRRLRRRLPDINVFAVSIEDLAAGDGSYVVIALNVVHLTADPDKAIQHLRHVAGPNPLIVVSPRPGITGATVVRSLRRLGVRHSAIGRFVLLHAALAPLTALARVGGAGNRSIRLDTARRHHRVADIVDVVVFDGLPDAWPHADVQATASTAQTRACR